MTSVSKILYIDKLDNIVNKYNNTFHSTIKINHIKSDTYFDSSKENNKNDPEFKISDIIRISKYKNTLAKGYTPIWSEEVFMIKKVKKDCAGCY